MARLCILADTLVVPLAPEKPVYDHNRVTLGLSIVIVELVCKVNYPKARGRME
jgi:hypothetical protein